MVNRAASGVPHCNLGASFLLSSIRELPELEDLLAGDEVAKVFEFKALDLLFYSIYQSVRALRCSFRFTNIYRYLPIWSANGQLRQ